VVVPIDCVTADWVLPAPPPPFGKVLIANMPIPMAASTAIVALIPISFLYSANSTYLRVSWGRRPIHCYALGRSLPALLIRSNIYSANAK
jgi:hypothetical protein